MFSPPVLTGAIDAANITHLIESRHDGGNLWIRRQHGVRWILST